MGAFKVTALSNNARLLTVSSPRARSVKCLIMFAAGSRYENTKNSGISHFLEHMFFKGTKQRPTAQHIAREIDGIGGEFNAFTGKEYTGYYVRCAAEHRNGALDVLADMLKNSKFEPDEIEREKGVIIEELNMHNDDPTSQCERIFTSLLYGDQPLGRDVLGTKESVQAVTRRTFLDYLRRWYKPSRMVIGVGGAVGEDIVSCVESAFGGLTDAKTSSPAPFDEALMPKDRVRIVRRESEQAHLCLGVRGYALTHPDFAALRLLAIVLGGGMSSRLFTDIRERRGLAYYVQAFSEAYTDVGVVVCRAGLNLSHIDDAIRIIVEHLRHLAIEVVPDDELEKARNLAKGHTALSLESTSKLLDFGVTRTVLEGKPLEVDAYLARFDRVTKEDLLRVAQELVVPESLRLAVVGPFDDNSRFDALLS